MTNWNDVRSQIPLEYGVIDFALLAQASTPFLVTEAIETYREALDRSPIEYTDQNNPIKQTAVFDAFERYFGVSPRLAAYTHSTTVGLGQLYGGIRMRKGEEILTGANEHFTTIDALKLRARRDGVSFRQVKLFVDSAHFSDDEVVRNISAAIRPWTRILALTWVYSSDGVKLPVRAVADAVQEENNRRGSNGPALLFVLDGVHGFGVEDVNFDDLGCDLFAAGCHKWLCGPRGTALMCGRERAWADVIELVPTFTPSSLGPGRIHIPGGVRAYEHFWAIKDAFEFVSRIGKLEISGRVHLLARRLKGALRSNPRIVLRTPMEDVHSAGIVCFDVLTPDGGDVYSASDVVRTLRVVHKIRTTESSWDPSRGKKHVRIAVTIFNSDREVDALSDVLKSAFRIQPMEH